MEQGKKLIMHTVQVVVAGDRGRSGYRSVTKRLENKNCL